jgi:hypothetical protein
MGNQATLIPAEEMAVQVQQMAAALQAVQAELARTQERLFHGELRSTPKISNSEGGRVQRGACQVSNTKRVWRLQDAKCSGNFSRRLRTIF